MLKKYSSLLIGIVMFVAIFANVPAAGATGPTASLLVQNNTTGGAFTSSLTASVGQTLNYQWSSTGGTSWSSAVTASPSTCPYTGGNWIANSASGSGNNYAVVAAQAPAPAGCVYSITYTVSDGSANAQSSITITVPAASSGSSSSGSTGSTCTTGALNCGKPVVSTPTTYSPAQAAAINAALVGPPSSVAPTATLQARDETLGGSYGKNVTANYGDKIDFQWSSANGAGYYSSIVDSCTPIADNGNLWPQDFIINTPSGNYSGWTPPAPEGGHTNQTCQITINYNVLTLFKDPSTGFISGPVGPGGGGNGNLQITINPEVSVNLCSVEGISSSYCAPSSITYTGTLPSPVFNLNINYPSGTASGTIEFGNAVVGWTYTLSITGGWPNTQFTICDTNNVCQNGTTDGNGNWTSSAQTFTTADIGVYQFHLTFPQGTQQESSGGTGVAPAILRGETTTVFATCALTSTTTVYDTPDCGPPSTSSSSSSSSSGSSQSGTTGSATTGSGSCTGTACSSTNSGTTTNTNPPVILSFLAYPTVVASGQSSNLYWNVTGATSLTISPQTPITSAGTGEVAVNTTQTTTYTLTATNSTGSAVAEATVVVNSGTTGTGGVAVGAAPPTIPTNLTASAGSSSINLSWTASTDTSGVFGYDIYRCQGSGCVVTVQIGQTSAASTAYTDTNVVAGTSYTYAVAAYDQAGNISALSQSATAQATASTNTNFSPTASYGLTPSGTSGTTVNSGGSAAPAPSAPANGTLVKSANSSTVYVVTNGSLDPFVSAAVFGQLGYSFNNVVILPDAQLNSLPLGGVISSGTSAHPSGSNVSTSGTVYYVGSDSHLHPYTSVGVYNTWNTPNDFSKVLPANTADLALPVGSAVLPQP